MKSIRNFILILLLACCCWAGAYFVFNKTNKERARTADYVVTFGEVVGHNSKYDPIDNDEDYDDYYFNPDYRYAPIVKYYVDGKEYKAHSDIYTREPPYIGDSIEVAYNPNDPSECIVDKTFNNLNDYITSVVLVVLGFVFIGVYFVISKKSSNKA